MGGGKGARPEGCSAGQVTGVAGTIPPVIENLDGLGEEPKLKIASSGENPLSALASSPLRSPSPSARIIRGGSAGCGDELAQEDFSLPVEGPMFNPRNNTDTAPLLGNGRSGRIALIKTAGSRPGPSQLPSPI